MQLLRELIELAAYLVCFYYLRKFWIENSKLREENAALWEIVTGIEKKDSQNAGVCGGADEGRK